jgi:multiple antibiotic resistance protein
VETWGEAFVLAFIPLFVAIDPLGLAPVFLGLTADMPAPRRRAVANQATLTAGLVAVAFLFLGQAVFRALGITVADFQVAGGLILLALAGRELLGVSETAARPSEELVGVVPLGLPLVAGPATLTTLLISADTAGLAITLLALAANMALVDLAFRFSPHLARLIGLRGLAALSKIVALLLAAIAVHMIRKGWQGL